MHVIRHHTPRQHVVALPMKMPDRIGHNFGDSKVAHITRAQSAVETALYLLQQARSSCRRTRSAATEAPAALAFSRASRCLRTRTTNSRGSESARRKVTK